MTTPNFSSGHGKIENSIGVITSTLRILIDQLDLPWDKVLKFTKLALNFSASTTLGQKSAFYFMFGLDSPSFRSQSIKLENVPDAQSMTSFWQKQLAL